MKGSKTTRNFPRGCAGFALLEVLISVLMLSLGVLALVGLQASMNANASDAKYRAEANYLANQLVGQMWVDQANLAKYAVSSGVCSQTYAACNTWISTVATQLPGGSADVVINGTTVDVTVRWQTPGSGADSAHNLWLRASVVS